MEKVVFLDRDGTINKSPGNGKYVTCRDDFHFLPGTFEALRLLKNAGYRLVLVTNQKCVATGILSAGELDEIHNDMQSKLRLHNAVLDYIFVCPHDENSCECRKPKPGLLKQAEAYFDVDKEKSFMIGDSERDIQAGKNYGVKTILISPDKGGISDAVCPDLLSAAQYIIKEDTK